jgi:hypothetical protein
MFPRRCSDDVEEAVSLAPAGHQTDSSVIQPIAATTDPSRLAMLGTHSIYLVQDRNECWIVVHKNR